MNLMRAASAMFLVSVTPALAADCLVQIDQVEWLFKANNKGFGPANVEILHNLTADFLGEREYHSGSEVITHEPNPAYTHRLSVEYIKGARTHSVALELEPLEGTKGQRSRVILATAPLDPKLKKAKRKEAEAELYDQAEEKYFLSIKKLPVCKNGAATKTSKTR